jgi:hypothetical protein
MKPPQMQETTLLLHILHCIALHSIDPKPVKMTIGYGIYHINTKNIHTMSLKPSHVGTQEYTVAAHTREFKCKI